MRRRQRFCIGRLCDLLWETSWFTLRSILPFSWFYSFFELLLTVCSISFMIIAPSLIITRNRFSTFGFFWKKNCDYGLTVNSFSNSLRCWFLSSTWIFAHFSSWLWINDSFITGKSGTAKEYFWFCLCWRTSSSRNSSAFPLAKYALLTVTLSHNERLYPAI